jgi:rhamnose transport system ATP-binding protein
MNRSVAQSVTVFSRFASHASADTPGFTPRVTPRYHARAILPDPLLRASSISKAFAGIQALRRVSFDLLTGEVHALVGENGAGKSTLIRIITGAETSDAGELLVAGHAYRRMDPAIARSLGIAAIYQQPSLFPDLTVAENIALALERAGAWRPIDWTARRRRAAEFLEYVGASIDPDRVVGSLSMPEQQLVEIAKAIGARAKVLIMDEPTAALADREVDRLMSVIERLCASGAGIIYISHRLEEVFRIASRITVLRDGETVRTVRADEVSRGELISMMVGRELTVVYPPRESAIGSDDERPALEVRRLSNRSAGIRDVSFSVKRGEILGIAGLVGSGRTQLAETLFGLTPPDAGEIVIDGRVTPLTRPADAIRAGLAYLPEDRRHHGVVMDMSVAANTSLASLDRVSRFGLLDRRAERRIAQRYVDQFRIKAPSVQAIVSTLSGGNQQKVALARWLATEPSVLILDEPTQGVDVGAKGEIHGLMRQLAARGMAIVMISSELPEVLGMCDRIAVMRAGAIGGILQRSDATQSQLLALALGADVPDHPAAED